MASVFEILSQNNYDPLNPVKSLIADEKAKLGLPTYVPYTEDFQFGTSESPTQTIYNPRKLELEDERAKLNSSNNNINLVHSQKGRIDSQEDNESYDISTLGNDKVTFAGVNDQYYDDNNVPKMSLVPEKEINTNNADYTSNVGD